MKRLFTTMLPVLIACVLMEIGVVSVAEAQAVVTLATGQFSWTPGVGGGVASQYNVKCGPATGIRSVTTAVLPVPPATTPPTTFPVSSVVGAGTWFCVVNAQNSVGLSADSNEVSFITGNIPSAPTGLTVK